MRRAAVADPAPGGGFKVGIPARYASSRLPGKPLRRIAGKPMIAHVLERALESGGDEIFVATDDERIVEAVEAYGAPCHLTAAHHPSGTDRLAEVARLRPWAEDEILVNLQGDEPCMAPELIRQVAADLAAHPEHDMATLATAITTREELFDPNVVKVVTAADGSALYFSRAPVPWDRDGFAGGRGRPDPALHRRHIGLYAYRVGFLRRYAGLAAAPHERCEMLEQLRVLWHGARIHVGTVAAAPVPGVDTEKDLQRAEACLRRRRSGQGSPA